MAISVILTFNSIAYDVSGYVRKESIEIDEYLFNELKPNTNTAKLVLSRNCPYLDELFGWSGDVQIAITDSSVAAFTGYLTDDHKYGITERGAQDVALSAEDPGIKKLKVDWVSTDTLATNFAGKKVCDPADTANSFVHILATLAGVTLASGLPTISTTLAFAVADKNTPQYWEILERVLFEHRHTFYFNQAGQLALFAFGSLQGTASQLVTTGGTVLVKQGKPGIEMTKRRYKYREVDVKFKETVTVASAVIFKDTTSQNALTDCVIILSAGEYYPKGCDASTYGYIDYYLEDGRKILAVGSAASDFIVQTGIVAEYTNLGTSARVRFHNPTAGNLTISRIRVNGTNVVAVAADSKVVAGEASKMKLSVDAKYLTTKAAAQELGNLLYYYYKNSDKTYRFRSYLGTLYPSDTLYPSTTLVPLGDVISLGELVRVYDPIFTGLDATVSVTRKKYTLGRYGADYEAVGIGAITLTNAVTTLPTATPVGQVAMTRPEVQAVADAAQAAAEANIPILAPRHLGRVAYASLSGTAGNENDSIVAYSSTLSECGIYKRVSGSWVDQTTPATALIMAAWSDILWATANSYPSTGTASEKVQAYMGSGVNYFETLAANNAFIQNLFVGSASITVTAGANIVKKFVVLPGENDPYSNSATYVLASYLTHAVYFQIGASGTVRFYFTLTSSDGSSVYCQVYKQAIGSTTYSAVAGTEKTTTTTAPGEAFTVDVACTTGDFLALYIKRGAGGSASINNISIRIAETPGILACLGYP